MKLTEREIQSARRTGRYLHNTQQTQQKNIYAELKIPPTGVMIPDAV